MNVTNTNCRFIVSDFKDVKQRMLNWANRFGIFCFLDNHNYQAGPHSIECILAAGVKSEFKAEPGTALKDLQTFIDSRSGWLFGHLGYDLKNEIENLSTLLPDRIQFPCTYFFEPEIVIRLSEKKLSIITDSNAELIFEQLMKPFAQERTKSSSAPLKLQQRFSRSDYQNTVNKLKAHILRGDCYEINFCNEFYAEDVQLDPFAVYKRLSDISPNPFSALYKLEDKFLICASPERFLKKDGNKLLSQPIKGTSSRYLSNEKKDKLSRKGLSVSTKDRSENVMIVDLVRNDLSRVCEEGSVEVDELFGIYSFPQVHQMISTISGKLKENIAFREIIKATFPMGSMTGAPKKSVMELIEKYERSGRGIFSGALGYINPEQDFDFNVVIRSIMYNSTEKYVSYQVGSGITFYSDAEQEYEECMLKAEAMMKSLMPE